MKFTATLELDGKTATGIEVPVKAMAALGDGKRIAVTVTINGRTRYASTVATVGGRPKIPVSADIRTAAGITAGDTVTVELERDDAPRTVELPPELAKALRADPAAATCFAALSYSNQKRHVLSVTGARTEETRARRIQKVIADVRPG